MLNEKKQEKTIDFMIRTTWQAIIKLYNEEASKYNSSMVNAFALLSIDSIEGTSSTALGPKMGVEPTSLTRTIKKLENEGYIKKVPNPMDGRGVILKLTDEGFRMREISKKTVLRFNECIRNEISDQQMKDFFDTLQKIQNIINHTNIFKN